MPLWLRILLFCLLFFAGFYIGFIFCERSSPEVSGPVARSFHWTEGTIAWGCVSAWNGACGLFSPDDPPKEAGAAKESEEGKSRRASRDVREARN